MARREIVCSFMMAILEYQVTTFCISFKKKIYSINYPMRLSLTHQFNFPYMKIAFHGAARTVTGSKHLISLNNGKKILLDCGMFQGLGRDTFPLNSNLGFDATTVTHLLLSHAHID